MLDESPPKNHVFLVHGLASSRYVMSPLAWRLRRDGYRTKNWGYWSLTPGIAAQAAKLQQTLDKVVGDPDVQRLDLVTHSMGCILMRWVLSHGISPKVRRWVMLGPPNRGSSVARNLARGLGWICPPLRELSDDPQSFVNCMNRDLDVFTERMREAHVQVGIIAASHDHMVPRPSTRLGLEADFHVANGLHTDILFRQKVYLQVRAFLQNGVFDRNTSLAQN